MRRFVLAASLAASVAAVPLVAQMHRPDMLHGNGAPADVKAGTYAVEPEHTQVAFSVSHMGISPFAGWFSGASGVLKLDPAKLDATTLSVSIPVASVQTTSGRLVEELKGADWLDAGKFPTATFRSTKVSPLGPDTARIEGELTLHGVTRPVVIDARFFGAATDQITKRPSVGFLGRLSFNRSDFGVAKYVPLVSNQTVLVINAAFALR